MKFPVTRQKNPNAKGTTFFIISIWEIDEVGWCGASKHEFVEVQELSELEVLRLLEAYLGR